MRESYGIVASVDELVRQRARAAHARVAPRGRVRTREAGAYDSSFRGRGMEFDETRAYQAGDDVRSIDWRVTARTGRVHTKLFHEERERPVLLLVDARPSMRFGTRDSYKSVLAARAASTLAWAARDGGDRVGGVVLAGSGEIELAPQRSLPHLVGLLRAISRATADETAASPPVLARAVRRLARVSRPGTMAFLISDFQDLDDAAEREIARLAVGRDVACVFVSDRLEAEAPGGGAYRVTDGDRVLPLSSGDRRWREAWAARFRERRERLQDLCRRHRVALVELHTGDDCAEVLRKDRFARAFGRGGRASA